MIVKNVMAHTIDNCTTFEEVIDFYDQTVIFDYPYQKTTNKSGDIEYWYIKDNKILYYEHLARKPKKPIHEFDIYHIDIDVFNIKKMGTYGDFTIIQTKNNQIHIIDGWVNEFAESALRSIIEIENDYEGY